MTDITELAQSLKAAAENAIGAHERLAAYPYGEIIDISQHEGEQIDIDITDLNEFNKEANPVNILALVEALEKAQAQSSKWLEAYHKAVSIGARYEERIAELEASHTKLRESMAAIHNTISLDGAGTSLATILNAAKRAYEESASVAGIKLDVQPAQPCEHSMFWDASGVKRCSKCDSAELDSSGIAPGILRCTKCSLVQTKNIISVTADTITTVNSESEPCPNGCGPLQPVTWKVMAIQLMFSTKQGVSDLLEAKKRIAELESFRTAYMEWSDKTDWVRTDRRFDVVKPLGKHLADVLRVYIDHLESRTVKLPKKNIGWDRDEDDCWNNAIDACAEALTTAGIKWEAE
ncbi:hypothetical protein SH579_06980 [Raoultella ornithinolytica]|uniref:ead/Ea22-like family protein n=1 Tax=Raoultella ornithinolytica TaxID=54291 RepID=UPI002A5AC09C|nr:ead/Ea22-like family protein [Raoultella ornithinolytica]WPO20665.1 hypothetical protein SH579_06980 [Raoultella ornithinolytica]